MTDKLIISDRQFRTIVIDPPWQMKKIKRRVRPNQQGFDYPTMTLEEIKTIKLPVNPEGCHVFLWTTHKYLIHAFDVFEAWDVEYQGVFTWCKNVGFTPFSWMYSTEHCLYGHIGCLPLFQEGGAFYAKVREHSRKPDEFYEFVRQVSPEPRIDIFSREERRV